MLFIAKVSIEKRSTIFNLSMKKQAGFQNNASLCIPESVNKANFMIKDHIFSVVKENAIKYGNRDVFRYRDSSKSIRAMNWTRMFSKCEQISLALLADGYGFESNIGILSHNCPEWTITDIAILGIRGVVVPVMATSSKEQIKYIVDETAMQILFAGNDEHLENVIWLLEHCDTLKKVVFFESAGGISQPGIITLDQFISREADLHHLTMLNRLHEEAKADDLATIVYTSGTTGDSKGVMLGHDAFIACFKNHDLRLDLSEKDVSVAFLPLSHIFERAWTYYMLYKGVVNFFLGNPKEVIGILPLVRPTLMCTVPRFFEKTYEGIEAEAMRWPTVKRKIFKWATATGMRVADLRSRKAKIPAGLRFKHLIAEKLVLKKLRSVFGGNIRFMPCAGAAIRPGLLHFFHGAGLFVNYGYGCTETTATVSCFRDDIYDFSTVGSTMPGVSVKTGQDGELLISGKTVFRGYYKKPADTAEALRDGWFFSGDKGRVTDNGFLYMDDRIKDLFKTSTGKYVSPQKLELLLGQDTYVEQIVVIGDNRKYVTALIVPSFDKLKMKAAELDLPSMETEFLIRSKELYSFMAGRLNMLQDSLALHERVVKFTLLPELFTIENGILTSTLKIKRKAITERYTELIEEMYKTT